MAGASGSQDSSAQTAIAFTWTAVGVSHEGSIFLVCPCIWGCLGAQSTGSDQPSLVEPQNLLSRTMQSIRSCSLQTQMVYLRRTLRKDVLDGTATLLTSFIELYKCLFSLYLCCVLFKREIEPLKEWLLASRHTHFCPSNWCLRQAHPFNDRRSLSLVCSLCMSVVLVVITTCMFPIFSPKCLQEEHLKDEACFSNLIGETRLKPLKPSLHRHRPQIEKVSETFLYVVRICCCNSGIAASQTLEPMCPNLKTTGSAFEELLVPQYSKQCFTILEPRVPNSKELNQRSQILEPRVPSSRNAWFPHVGTNASQSWNHGFPIWRTPGSQTLDPMLPNFGTTGFQFEELLVPKPWNQRFNLGTSGS